jgi:uncharacterized pyridoxamine 5'-phosphate oxidase family protein
MQRIEEALQAQRFAILATESSGQPHASLIAITPVGGIAQLILATYRNSQKYRNLIQNRNVALFIDCRESRTPSIQDGFVLTARGNAVEIRDERRNSSLRLHLQRHPDLDSFLHSSDCAIICLSVEAYQLVVGIDDVTWYQIG